MELNISSCTFPRRDGAKEVPSHLDPTSPDYIGPQLGPAAQLLLQGGAKKTHNPFVRSVRVLKETGRVGEEGRIKQDEHDSLLR